MEESKMKLILKDDSTIEIYNNDEKVLTLASEDKTIIKAEDIFNTLKYQAGKNYELLPIQENTKPELNNAYEAFKKIYNFYSQVILSVNEVDIKDDLTEEIAIGEEVY